MRNLQNREVRSVKKQRQKLENISEKAQLIWSLIYRKILAQDARGFSVCQGPECDACCIHAAKYFFNVKDDFIFV